MNKGFIFLLFSSCFFASTSNYAMNNNRGGFIRWEGTRHNSMFLENKTIDGIRYAICQIETAQGPVYIRKFRSPDTRQRRFQFCQQDGSYTQQYEDIAKAKLVNEAMELSVVQPTELALPLTEPTLQPNDVSPSNTHSFASIMQVIKNTPFIITVGTSTCAAIAAAHAADWYNRRATRHNRTKIDRIYAAAITGIATAMIVGSGFYFLSNNTSLNNETTA